MVNGQGYLFKSPGSYEVKKEIFIQAVAAELDVNPKSLLLPHQTHSTTIWKLSSQDVESLQKGMLKSLEGVDAVICPRSAWTCAVGVQSADCAPVLGKTNTEIFAIHAGWIGLRDQIIKKALEQLAPTKTMELYVGPCATHHYERDRVEIESIPDVVWSESEQNGKGYLNVKETAVAQIRDVLSHGEIEFTIDVSPVCTLSDDGWLSYRRTSVEYVQRGVPDGFAKARQQFSKDGYAVNNVAVIRADKYQSPPQS